MDMKSMRWREDRELLTVEAKIAELEQDLPELESAVKQASNGTTVAADAVTAAENAELLGRGSARDVEVARKASLAARKRLLELSEQMTEQRRRLEAMRVGRAVVLAEAQARAGRAIMGAFQERVRRLRDALRLAAAVNTELYQLEGLLQTDYAGPGVASINHYANGAGEAFGASWDDLVDVGQLPPSRFGGSSKLDFWLDEARKAGYAF